MRLLYDVGMRAYRMAIGCAAIFKPKARQWIAGRKGIFQQMEKTVEKGAIWVHAASLGEFEQGRPLIEAIKEAHPHQKILLTFFSPSGYELRKNYQYADYVFYLPLDTSRNAQKFLAISQPKCAIFIKYEFWYHYITALHRSQVPLYSISAIFRPSQLFFKWYGGWFKKMLWQFDHIFVQNESSAQLLQRNGISKVTIAGDTRVDRVWDIQQKARIFPIVKAFSNHKKVLVAGSTWGADEEIIAAFCAQNYPLPFKIIIAPHDIHPSRIDELFQKLPTRLDVVRYSRAKNFNVSAADILIIDNIGMLSAIYRYGNWAYIGGAFGSGLHNTLEPIAFGLPVIFGEKYHKFEEARWLVEHGGGFSIENIDDFNAIIQQLQQEEFYQTASEKALQYLHENRGATHAIMTYLEEKDVFR